MKDEPAGALMIVIRESARRTEKERVRKRGERVTTKHLAFS